jgi:hypothetical protein
LGQDSVLRGAARVHLVGIAREAAPEIDRLVLSVNRRVGPKHGTRLGELARERGLETLELLPHFGDFLLAGRLTRDLAILRMRYWPPERVLARLDELEEKQLIRQGDSGLVATSTLRPLLEALLMAQADVAAEAWGGHHDDVGTAAQMAREIGAAASDDHVVAVAHRALPPPADPYLLLEHRLVTLRFIRQHDHAMAWLARGLTAPDMVIMTKLWQNNPLGEPSDGLTRLIELGFVGGNPPRLTAAGGEVREAIEADTNEKAQQTFDVLDDPAATEFLAALRRIPGVVD